MLNIILNIIVEYHVEHHIEHVVEYHVQHHIAHNVQYHVDYHIERLQIKLVLEKGTVQNVQSSTSLGLLGFPKQHIFHDFDIWLVLWNIWINFP